MAEKPEQVTPEEVELWLTSRVTKAYLYTIAQDYEQCIRAAGTGALVDSSNADMTHAQLHSAMGKQHAYATCAEPVSMLAAHQMIFEPEPEKEDGGS